MDLTTIEQVLTPATLNDLPAPAPTAAYLAGGTWLFSEPQPTLRTLIDLTTLRWPPLEWTAAGLRIAATCTIAELAALQIDAPAAPLIPTCCRALLGSFKIWNTATVGGNVCLALPAAPMLTLTVALDGAAHILRGPHTVTIPMKNFAIAPQRTVLAPGDLLRAIDIPATALARRTALRQASLTPLGRSAALLAATRDPAGAFALTITASTNHPHHLTWPTPPAPATLDAAITSLPRPAWHDDVHGTPAWRRHMTRRLAVELLDELG